MMIADLFEVKEAGAKGKGVFATKFIPKGTIVYFGCEKCRKLNSKKEMSKLSKEERHFYAVHGRYCDERLCYNNHSCNANVMDLGNGVDIVVRNIKKGEEQTEDYRILCKKEVPFGRFAGGCRCGEPNCMHKKTYRRPPSKELRRIWNRKINGVMRLVSIVKQPLKRQVLKEHPDLQPFFNKNRKNGERRQLEKEFEKIRNAPTSRVLQ